MNYSISLFFICFTFTAQTKGVVKDSISNKPIPYVNIWVENESIASTSEENGDFVINTTEKSKYLVFSAIGYQKKTLPISKSKEILLQPIDYQLNEVQISNRLGKKELEIGRTENTIRQAFDNGPRIDAKFFPYLPKYKKIKYIKKVVLITDSKIDNALIRLRFYKVDENGYPGEELLNKEVLVTIKKGTLTHQIDVTNYNLILPKKGMFVGFEKLLIESNSDVKILTDSNTNTSKTVKTYYPFILYNYVERDHLFVFSAGKWMKKTNEDSSISIQKKKVYEPAIYLVLTN